MYYYGYQGGYNYGSPCGCSGTPAYNYGGCCNNGYGFGSNAAIILVLFILLVIVIGSRLVA